MICQVMSQVKRLFQAEARDFPMCLVLIACRLLHTVALHEDLLRLTYLEDCHVPKKMYLVTWLDANHSQFHL